MASISPSSSPRWDSRWDNRNSGFISPSQLQLWKQHQEQQRQQLLQHSPLREEQSQSDQEPNPSAAPSADASSQPQPAMFRTSSRPDVGPGPSQPSAPTHTRTTSAFSLFKSRPQHNPTPSTVSLPARPSEAQHNGFGPQQTSSFSSNGQMAAGSSSHAPGGPESSQPPAQGSAPMPTPNRSSTLGSPQPAPAAPPLHPEIRSIVQLTVAHGRKIYFSGPLTRHMEREADGQRPRKDDGWSDVWAQLGGTTLSVWDMKEIEEASKQGRQVPPSYVNITDAFVQVLGSVTIPATATSPAKKYTNVLTLNTAGSNLLLFACPSTQALLSWTAAMRLAAWEKSRLEELYTAHLIRITLQDGRDTPTPLVHGRMEGWVQVRIAGQTDWRRLWMVISAGGPGGHAQDHGSVSSTDQRSGTPTVLRKKRISSLFSRDTSPPRVGPPVKPTIQLFSSNKPKDKKKAALTMRDVSQAFAVYPERPELISRSTLAKVEGLLGDEELAGPFRNREGWLLIMPEMDVNKAVDMLKWLTAVHDAFELYGRPRMYSWDPRDPRSMMFAYPIGPNKDLLFFDREVAETLDPRDDRTSAIRAQLQHILWDRMRGSPEQSQSPSNRQAPTLPPLPEMTLAEEHRNDGPSTSGTSGFSGSQPLQLPPLSFESVHEHDLPEIPSQAPGPRPLTPITERSDPRNSNPASATPTAPSSFQQPSAFPSDVPPHPNTQEMEDPNKKSSFLGGPISFSPPPSSPPLHAAPEPDLRGGRPSMDSYGASPGSRPDSKLGHFPRQPTSPGPLPPQSYNNSSTYQQQENIGRQPQTNTFSRRYTETSISSGPQQSSRSDSPRPSMPPSVPSHQDPSVAHPPSPHFSVLTSPHSLADVPVNARHDPSGRPSSPNMSVLSSPHSIPPESPSRRDPNNYPPSPHFSASESPATVRRPGSRLSVVQDAASSNRAPISPGPLSHTATTPTTSSLPTSQYPSSPSSPSTPASTAPLRQRSPSAAQVQPPAIQSTPSNQPPPLPSKDDPAPELLREAGAWYYMRLEQGQTEPRRQPPPPTPDDDTSSESDSAYSPTPAGTTQPSQQGWGSPPNAPVDPANPYSPPQGQANPAKPPAGRTFSPDSGYSPKMASPPMRKPSGARAVPASHGKMSAQRDQHPAPSLPPADVDEADEDTMSDDLNTEERGAPRQLPPRLARQQEAAAHDDQADAADVLAALSFLEREEAPAQPQPKPAQPQAAQSPRSPQSPPVPQVIEPRSTSPTGSVAASIRSSFAPSKQAAQRKAKSQAQQAAQQAAVSKPGRSNGGQRKMRDANAWGESSEEEEEEDDEEDDDADSDDEPRQRTVSMGGRGVGSNSQVNVNQQDRPTPEGSPGPQQRRPRDLPRVPGQPPQGSQEYLGPQPRRFVSDQYPASQYQGSQYPASMYTDAPNRQASPQYQNPTPMRPTNRWNQVLEREQPEAPARDTFVQIEPPAQTMTKAFAPHGLLSAGLQDKQDRSAKRQEELARESGASLINVPNKPPPPQTGLLGAVTAHERERKREGGLGAALTEREREKRIAEERQRKLDEMQRMQLEQMQQGGSMYGGMGMAPQFTGYNPMMGNPMMMGMNPMMTGWGYPGMMNPQHMFAAQQAAQAYQQAMATFSTAGSQVGGDTGNPQPMNPMMTGMSMGMGFDPRMSMMGMPMLSPQMTGMGGMGGMGGGMSPGMGMGMGGMGMGGMGMNPQMTGGGFDASFPPGNDGGLRAPTDPDGPGSRPYSQNSSVNGQNSPAGPQRPLDDGSRKVSGNVQ